MFTLAHLSDLHLGPLPRADSWRDYLGKRALGKISWHRRRRFLHDPAIAMAMVADIKAHAPDHVALTGDLINIALKQEFVHAAEWLQGLRCGRLDHARARQSRRLSPVPLGQGAGCGPTT